MNYTYLTQKSASDCVSTQKGNRSVLDFYPSTRTQKNADYKPISREEHERIEKVISAWLSNNLWSKIKGIDHRYISSETETDRQLQYAGVDMRIWRTSSPEKVTNIDEKAKVYSGKLNSTIDKIGFEVICKNRFHSDYFDSWLISEKSKTDYVNFISVFAERAKEPTDLTDANIEAVNCLLVRKQSVLDDLARLGLGIDELKAEAHRMIQRKEYYRRIMLPMGGGESPWYFAISRKSTELPIQVIAPRDYILGLPGTKSINAMVGGKIF